LFRRSQIIKGKHLGYNLPMDATILIVRTNGGYNVRVFLLGTPTRSWLKVYYSKAFCMTELKAAEVIMPAEAKEALTDYFETAGDMLIFQTDVEPTWLKVMGFTELKKVLIN
jgi:hypothetical protein